MKRLFLSTTILFVNSTALFSQQGTNEIERIVEQRKLMDYELIITPNPASGPVKIQAPDGATCRIVSTKGTYVGTWTLESGELHLEDMPLGTYIIHVDYQDMHLQRRLIVL